MSARNQVESLLLIIKEAAYSALEQYETTGVLVPVLDSTKGHPLDQVDDSIALKKIISKLEGACEQLCTTLAPPSHTIMNRAQDYGWACLHVAVQLKLADELADKPNGLHVDELAVKVNVNPMKLASILRVLAAKHCFREVSPDVFANNRLSVNLVSDSSLSALVDLIAGDGQAPAALLPQYLVDPDYGKSLSMTKALFQFRRKDQGVADITFYEWMQLKAESQERRKVMMKAMGSMNSVMGSQAALPAYSWNNVKSLCDVGSGLGAFSRSLLERFPEVRVVQFDLAPTIAIAEQHWNGAFANRNEFVSGDFLVELPVKNCDVYYLRTILHNWTDDKAVTILKSVRRAMGQNSRVLVHDHVLRHMCPPSLADADGLDIAPEPMLPNYGAGAARLYHQDLTMVMTYNTRERTTNEAIDIGKKANLRLIQVIDLAEMCLIEFGIAEE